MINAEFTVLYKNGREDVIKQQATEEQYEDVIETFGESFKEDCPAIITFGNGEDEGYFIRLSDVVRVKVRILE